MPRMDYSRHGLKRAKYMILLHIPRQGFGGFMAQGYTTCSVTTSCFITARLGPGAWGLGPGTGGYYRSIIECRTQGSDV